MKKFICTIGSNPKEDSIHWFLVYAQELPAHIIGLTDREEFMVYLYWLDRPPLGNTSDMQTFTAVCEMAVSRGILIKKPIYEVL